MDTFTWYQKLNKPSWSPEPQVFGQVWSVLYVLIAISFFKVAQMFFTGQIKFVVFLPFILNLFFNIIFTPIQFGLRSNVLATVDILLVLITIVWSMVAIYKTSPWIAALQVPYLVWVTIATALQISITWLNWQR